jgi:iron complex outermembrane recepter protein
MKTICHFSTANFFGFSLPFLMFTAGLASAPALAQTAPNSAQSAPESAPELQEVIVTAQKREESIQTVPVSVAVLTGADLQNLGVTDVNDYFKYIPGLNYAPAATGDRGGDNIVIRGVSNTRLTGVDAAASAATTSFYLNGIPVTLIDPQLIDVNRVEVLKGPQGTLFGAAAMGGTVKIIMNEPDSHEYSGQVDATGLGMAGGGLGERVDAVINIPLISDVLGARLVVYQRFDPGWINVIRPLLTDTSQALSPSIPGYDVLGAQASGTLLKNTNTTSAEGARLALLFTPNDKLKLEPTLVYQNETQPDPNTFDANLNDGYVKQRFVPEPQGASFSLASLEGSYDFGPAQLISATGYFTRNYLETIDETEGTFLQFGGTGVTPSCPQGNCIAGVGALGTQISTNSFTQELRLQSTGHSGSDLFNRFDWVVGAYYSQETRHGQQLWQIPGFNENAAVPVPAIDDVIFASNWTSVDLDTSVFADVGFHITDKFKISAGLRHYDQSERTNRNLIGPLQGTAYDTTNEPTFESNKSQGVTPRYIASYQFTDNFLAYASAAKGFRAGGGVIPVTEPACAPVVAAEHLQAFTNGFQPDSLWQYELGVKTSWADKRIDLDAAIYDIKWTDLQQSISLNQFFESNCTAVLTANVGDAEIKGAEVELKALATNNLSVQASFAYTPAKITSTDGLSGIGYVGAPLQNVPFRTGTLGLQYTFPDLVREGSGYLRGDYSYRSSMTTTVGVSLTNPYLNLPSYSNVNFRAGVDWHKWNFETFIENAFNTIQLISATPGSGVATTQESNYPRTVGIKVGRKF